MKKLIFILFLTISCIAFSQKQTAFWYFGELAGIDFNSGNPIAVTDSKMVSNEGCATISDGNGNLLFYTNGQTVWNSNHEIMINGTNLKGHFSSTNSAIIVPKPNDVGKYYIFTVDDLGGPNGLQYTEVDMLIGGGLGAVTSTKNIVLDSPTLEKITAVKHQNDIDWWVLSHKWNSNDFIAYRVTNSGVSSAVVSSVGAVITGDSENTVGNIKFSPNGKMLAIAHSYQNNRVELLEFNDVTGQVSNRISLTGFNGAFGVYGVEFSPDSNFLYVADSSGSIYQYQTNVVTASEIISSKTEIANSISGLGAIQLAPDGKIYAARENSSTLGAITNPNNLGVTSAYVNDFFSLNGRRSKLGLPPFIQSFFWKAVDVDDTCYGGDTQFTMLNPEVTHAWNFNDPTSGINNSSLETNPIHVFSSPGFYNVEVTVTNFLGETSVTKINVAISETPIATLPIDYIACESELEDNSHDGITDTFLLSSKDSEILGGIDYLVFDVQYYEDDLHTRIINKNINYVNTTTYNQTIYAKVFNRDNDECFASVEFDLIVNDLPYFEVEEEFVICSNILPAELRVQNPQGIYNYEWRLEDGTLYSSSETILFSNVDFIPIEGLLFNVTATNPITLCETAKSVLVRRFDFFPFTLDDISITDLSKNNTIRINTNESSYNVDEYVFGIDSPYNDNIQYQNDPIFQNVIPGIRKLYIKDIHNCQEFEFEIPIIGFQKFFTPNNDGYNDTWQILGVNENFYNTSIINIYDRFGKIIANVDPKSIGWNGTYNGTELPASDYWFSVKLIDQNGNTRDKKGHFSLIRR
jgi:gliding motility-associated-like protein